MTLVQQPTTGNSEWEPDAFDLEPHAPIHGDRDGARVLTRIQAAAADRLQRMTWQEVADRNGYASRGAACAAVLGYLRRRADETVGALRDQESAALDAAAQRLHAKLDEPRVQDTWLRNRAAFRALHGLNAPLQVTLSSGAQAALVDALGDAEAMIMGLVTARSDEPLDGPVTPGWDGA